jgi:uncharacterized protein YukE
MDQSTSATMRETMRQSGATANEARSLANPFSEAAPETVQALSGINDTTLKTVSSFQDEWLKFARTRYSENLDLWHRLMSCRTPVDLSRTYSEFWSKAVSQYGDTFRDVGHMAGQARDQTSEDLKQMGEAFKQNVRHAQNAGHQAGAGEKTPQATPPKSQH